MFLKFFIGLIVLGLTGGSIAQEGGVSQGLVDESDLLRFSGGTPAPWGISMELRMSSIPFATEDDVVSDLVPNFHYEGERYFPRGRGI